MNKPLVMLLAGGGGTRLGVLVQHRAKPAVPFGGRYRIIDFALSNVMHAELDQVGVLTQYKPLSLMEHIGIGESWNFQGRRRGVHILPPRTGEAASDWYQGTADAIWQNADFMESQRPERVLILSGDHIYRMDYRRMLADHLERRADVTLAVMEVEPEDTARFGMVWTDEHGEVARFAEKPKTADTRLASMGIYLFEWPCLAQALREIVGGKLGVDFGHDIMPRLLGNKRMITHRFDGYWRDVGTIQSYFAASMDLLHEDSGLDLGRWEICSSEDTDQLGDRPPTRLGHAAEVVDSLVAAGGIVEGAVQRAILSPEVRIGRGARVEDAILMHGVTIEPGAVVRRAILDKGVRVGSGCHLDGGRDVVANEAYGKCQLAGMVVVGKNVRIPAGLTIGSNVVIEAGATEHDFKGDLKDGATLHVKH